MSEQYVNLASSTTAGTVNNSSNPVTFSVQAGDGALFPATTNGSFRVTVANADDTNAEVMLCTSRTGDSLTCARGSSATLESPVPTLLSHANGSVVSHSITSGAATQILTDWVGYGTTANLPSTSGRFTGQRYRVTDGSYEYIFNGSVWVPYYRGIKTAIPTQSFSWINQGGASVTTQTDNSILLQGTANGGVNMQIRVFSVSAPYKYKFILTPMLNVSNNSRCGVLFSNGTAHSDIDATIATANVQLEGVNMTNSTTVSATFNFTSVPTVPNLTSNQPLILGLEDDNTNRKYYWYPDGNTEILLFSVARTTFLTATEVGFFVDDNSSNKGTGVILNGIDKLI